MERVIRKNKTSEQGQALVLVTFGITALLGLLGLIIDVGFGYYLKQSAQAAADAGALAAAAAVNSGGGTCSVPALCNQTSVSCPVSPASTTYAGIACQYAKTNGFVNTGNQTVTLSSGTGLAPAGVTTAYWVTVTAGQSLPLSFSRIFGASTASPTASASAGVIVSGATGGCIYVMNSTASQSLQLSGNNSFINSDCGIYVNSSSSSALTANGGATVKGSVVDVVGGVSLTGGSTVTPTAVTGVSTIQDPLSRLSAPAVGSCDHTSTNISQGVTTLSPGVYCNGIQISGNSTVTFSPGNYILNGGGLTINSANSTVTGAGVFFYNTASGHTFGPLLISGQPNVTLSAPTTGTYRGVLFFADRNISTASTNSINGSTSANLSGSIYVPKEKMQFSGGSTTSPTTMAIVCDTLQINGGSYLKKDTTGLLTGFASTGAMLIQ